MKASVWLPRAGLSLVLALAFCAACARLPQYTIAGPSPTPAISPSPTSQPSGSASCESPAASTTAFIVISVTVLPSAAPLYGPINGYVEANSDGTFGVSAQVVSLHTSDIVQFVNVDDYSAASAIYHSAVGFPAATMFPASPYSFPASTIGPIGSAISTAPWSTGRLGAICYSQTFSLTAGTYYFGDYDFYNSLNSLRGVVTVQSGSDLMKRRALPIAIGH